MAHCTACAQENPDAARFCFACGKPMDAPEPGLREERRIVSVVFVDLVDSTARAERLDPEDVRGLLERYHDDVRREIESFGGVVEKYIGDAVMAVFGAPTAFGDDAERSVRAALAVQERIARSTDGHQARIAVNTGEALVSLSARPAYGEAMVAGDVVNTAARLQSGADPGTVIVGEETWRATRDIVRYEPAAPVDAKGKSEPLRAWTAVGVGPQGERHVGSTFVGRGRELELLREIWQRSRDDRAPHLVTVIGPAGAGKSRLALEFGRETSERGGLVVTGRSLPYRESSAYGAFASHIKQLCHIFESDPPQLAERKLRETVATLLDAAGADQVASHLAVLIGLDADTVIADRETLFFSVRVFIEAVAADRPTMLVFEDLHWADTSLLDLVELVAARLRDLPIVILVLARPELLDARPAWGGGLSGATMLALGPLSERDARRLAAERLAAHAIDLEDADAAELAATAAGNPLFIEQLAATLLETSASGASALPNTIRGLLAARLDALPAAERSLLLDAAVGGRVFWRGALERMGAGGSELSDLLGALERRDLIRRDTVSAIEGDQQFGFTHGLIRDVAYDLLPRARRQARHEQCALYLESATAEIGEAGAALARHWRDAGNKPRALEYALSAANEAEQGWAKDRAVTFYREALTLLEADDMERRKQMLRKLALAQQAQYHIEDARAALERGESA